MAKLIIYAYFYHLLAVYSHAYIVEKQPIVDGEDKQPFSIDDVAFYDQRVDVFNGTWISNTKIAYINDKDLCIFDMHTQKSNRVYIGDPLSLFPPINLTVISNADGSYILFKRYTKNIYSYVPVNNYSICHYHYDEASDYHWCDDLDLLVKGEFKGELLPDVLWAPKGNALVYILDNDIYYRTIDPNRYNEKTVRRITTSGIMEQIFNGIADWIYREEVYQGDHRLMWFSPNAEHLAFITLNDSTVDDMVISRYNTPGTLNDQYPEVVSYKYPKAGRPIPKVSLNLIDLTNNDSSLIELSPPSNVGSEPILSAINWLDDKTIVSTWTNRAQNYSQIVAYSLDGTPNLLSAQQSDEGWLLADITNQPPEMYSNYVFIIEMQPIDDPKLGLFPHLIRYVMDNGKLVGRVDLTPEATWVTKIIGIDGNRRIVYYIGTPPGEPSQKHLYSVSFKEISKPKCLSCDIKTREGNACKYVGEISFSKDFSYCSLACTGPDPTSIIIYNVERRAQAFEWFGNSELRQMLDQRAQPQMFDLMITVDKFDAKVRLLLPSYFDNSRKYPMIVKVYGGPNSQAVIDEFAIGFQHYMTTKRQVVYAFIDGRGTNSKGTSMMFAVYRKLGNIEMEDQITVTRKLQENFSWIDKDRTGIWGRSYGGYSTAMILTKDHSNVFKCGIAVAPVTSWLYYEAIYTERYMGSPEYIDNHRAYVESQVTEYAENLRDKMFMLVHGTGDDNVHLQQSMALSKALVDAGVLFEQFFYTDENHPLNNVYPHLYHNFDKFFSQCFEYDLK